MMTSTFTEDTRVCHAISMTEGTLQQKNEDGSWNVLLDNGTNVQWPTRVLVKVATDEEWVELLKHNQSLE